MKLRFVKFLTSLENEIEKKEEGGRRSAIACSSIPQLGRGQSPLSFHLLLPSSFPSPLPPSSSTSLHSPPPQLARRHVSGEQYSPAISSPAVPLLPFFFIKLLKQQSGVVVAWRSAQPAGPAVLPNDNMRAPSSPHLALH